MRNSTNLPANNEAPSPMVGKIHWFHSTKDHEIRHHVRTFLNPWIKPMVRATVWKNLNKGLGSTLALSVGLLRLIKIVRMMVEKGMRQCGPDGKPNIYSRQSCSCRGSKSSFSKCSPNLGARCIEFILCDVKMWLLLRKLQKFCSFWKPHFSLNITSKEPKISLTTKFHQL